MGFAWVYMGLHGVYMGFAWVLRGGRSMLRPYGAYMFMWIGFARFYGGFPYFGGIILSRELWVCW
jgi:hypothetical protein